jgi:hypothetical protein
MRNAPCFVAAAAYVIYGFVSNLAFVKKATGKLVSRKKAEAKTEGTAEEWLAGTNYAAHVKAKSKKEAAIAKKAE